MPNQDQGRGSGVDRSDDFLQSSAAVRLILQKLQLQTRADLARFSAEELLIQQRLSVLEIEEIRLDLASCGLSLRNDIDLRKRLPKDLKQALSAEQGDHLISSWMSAFRAHSTTRQHFPLWVLDLCPGTRQWLAEHNIRTVAELLANTEDDLWRLALNDQLPEDTLLAHFDELNTTLSMFNLTLQPTPAPVLTIPDLDRHLFARYPLNALPLLAETVYRLRKLNIVTLGDLNDHNLDLRSHTTVWPLNPQRQVHNLLNLVRVFRTDASIANSPR